MMTHFVFITECPSLSSISGGFVIVHGYRTDATAVYNCNEGFELIGESVRVCRNDSTWAGEAPVCACEFKNAITTLFVV